MLTLVSRSTEVELDYGCWVVTFGKRTSMQFMCQFSNWQKGKLPASRSYKLCSSSQVNLQRQCADDGQASCLPLSLSWLASSLIHPPSFSCLGLQRFSCSALLSLNCPATLSLQCPDRLYSGTLSWPSPPMPCLFFCIRGPSLSFLVLGVLSVPELT